MQCSGGKRLHETLDVCTTYPKRCHIQPKFNNQLLSNKVTNKENIWAIHTVVINWSYVSNVQGCCLSKGLCEPCNFIWIERSMLRAKQKKERFYSFNLMIKQIDLSLLEKFQLLKEIKDLEKMLRLKSYFIQKTPLGYKVIINNSYEGMIYHTEIFENLK